MTGTRYSVEFRPVLPERLKRLEELANDLYYSWDRGVRGLFRRLDHATWDACSHNPKVFLRRVPQHRLDEAARDPMFLTQYRRALSAYDTYLEEKPHSQFDAFLDPGNDLVAYFSAEFGFHQSIPIYAGGLGILAADYCKAMSHMRVPFVGVGLLYHQGYFTQRLHLDGEQQADYPYIEPDDLPLTAARGADGTEIRVQVEMLERQVVLKVWEAKVGHIRLYLLDSDLPENDKKDRPITYQLYGGDVTTRIQQEMVLGIGGVRALRALDLHPTVWHINEGHAAFQILERCREHTTRQLPFSTALELVAAATVFTTHTQVPAGHDIFNTALMRSYLSGFAARLGTDERRFLALGAAPGRPDAFNMTTLALRGSRYHNGVSRIHGDVASRMVAYVWPQVPPGENPIGHVTNGIDVSTFQGLAWASLFDMYLDTGWRARLTDKEFWGRFIDRVPDHAYQSVHQILKAEMLEDFHHRTRIQYLRNGCSESLVRHITRNLAADRLDTLVIGFARRFATYKRAMLPFKDLKRLARLVNDPERPVLFIFGGKAHPHDQLGRQLIREIAEISMLPKFQGRVLLLEDYNFSMARKLLPGVDVWLNVPEYPKEACGTSGMKAGINGAINLSMLDGWWGEAYDGKNGWAITPHPELEPETRDEQEAGELLNILEHEVIPLFFQRNAGGLPEAWIRKSKASMKSTMSHYNSERMALDYLRDYYAPACRHGRQLARDDARGARELATWKGRIAQAWPGVRARLANNPPRAVTTGEPMPIEVAVHLNGLAPEEVIVECVMGQETELGDFVPAESINLTPSGEASGDETLYRIDLTCGGESPAMKGLGHYTIRLYPYHHLLGHRFETGCMVWL